jgi:hypothetical protein
MNNYILNWKRLKKFKAKHRPIVEDKPYTREQIKKLVEVAPLRDKAIILLMASSGMRCGALSVIRLRDIETVEKYGILKFRVYTNEQESYIIYCTPECTRLIDQCLKWRERLGEKFTQDTPLFRVLFDTVTEVNRSKAVTADSAGKMVKKLLEQTGTRVPNELAHRTELMQCHGLKFFKYSEYLMGHRSGLTKSYFKPTDQELLVGNDIALGYVAAINDLTINEEYRPHGKIDELTRKKNEIEIMESKHNEEIKAMRDQMSQIISMIQHNPKLTQVKPDALLKKNFS